jgi:hypothetical protein
LIKILKRGRIIRDPKIQDNVIISQQQNIPEDINIGENKIQMLRSNDETTDKALDEFISPETQYNEVFPIGSLKNKQIEKLKKLE